MSLYFQPHGATKRDQPIKHFWNVTSSQHTLQILDLVMIDKKITS